MEPKKVSGSYSRLEGRWLGSIKRADQVLFGPLVRLLAALKVPPNAVSLLQPALGVAMVFTVGPYPRLTLALLLLAVLLDGVDGTLVRAVGRASAFGALMDQFCDHAREILLVAGLARIGALSPSWAVLYAIAYPGLNVVLLLCSQRAVTVPVAIRTYVTFYPLLILYLLAGVNWLTPAAIAAVAFMVLGIADGLRRLSRAMGDKPSA